MSSTRWIRAIAAAAAVMAVSSPVSAYPPNLGPWEPANLEVGINSAQADGCPIESFDGLQLYFASTRPGAIGGATDPNDIWVASRSSIDAPWATPQHLPAPVNSSAADFCPTPLPGKQLYFVSARTGAGTCGAGDIYRTRRHPVSGWEVPTNLGCAASGTGPNFRGGEFSPSVVEIGGGTALFYSSTGSDGLDQDIYLSWRRSDGTFGTGTQINELSTSANDQMPNVSRDGLEMVVASDRAGGFGALDVYRTTRSSTADPWSAPVNLGSNINTAAGESRPSLSGDGHRLHFGRLGDIWVSMRE